MYLLLRALNLTSDLSKKILSITASFHNTALIDRKLKIIFKIINSIGSISIDTLNENIASVKVYYTNETFKNSFYRKNSPIALPENNTFEELKKSQVNLSISF